ncbi:hypothetical protein PGT21_008974 [Puccinia graminis f. sp. tritici]|uniref:Uncharacterized protein n=1 Tax=Puccinia graminis f. sp. tritici TaxID=56615 RepID=A0A5B0R523_PUCGR|nr:hypothetical protein PGT21_009181 [Puccinia graminis f. sp. tritici]KAA1117487.1 hypothetical protein PGT21_008974 [Puccinia graminis f. sp. tritici]KAA1120572.1 hypothetical protein PGTUg99_022329 [Puccinia graminis f. sp. tritici]KAA1123291.1 hypothetical protein PGTUg99_021282 [Puccinia graminis f. sp. tritici]
MVADNPPRISAIRWRIPASGCGFGCGCLFFRPNLADIWVSQGIPGAKRGNTAGRNPSRRARSGPISAPGHVFDKTNTTAAAIAAIVVTNFILISYIFAALSEPDDEKNNNTITDLQKMKKKDS